MGQTEKFSMSYYFSTLVMMLRGPRSFFSNLPSHGGVKGPLGFLLCSSLFYTGACIMDSGFENPLVMGGIYLLNAVGMTLSAAGLGYLTLVMTMGKRITFSQLISIYALSSGVTLLVSWMPNFICLTESWKWWLIWTGMTKGFGFRWTQAGLIIGVSLGVTILFFWSVLQVIS